MTRRAVFLLGSIFRTMAYYFPQKSSDLFYCQNNRMNCDSKMWAFQMKTGSIQKCPEVVMSQQMILMGKSTPGYLTLHTAIALAAMFAAQHAQNALAAHHLWQTPSI